MLMSSLWLSGQRVLGTLNWLWRQFLKLISSIGTRRVLSRQDKPAIMPMDEMRSSILLLPPIYIDRQMANASKV
jgi:hypothetical protein